VPIPTAPSYTPAAPYTPPVTPIPHAASPTVGIERDPSAGFTPVPPPASPSTSSAGSGLAPSLAPDLGPPPDAARHGSDDGFRAARHPEPASGAGLTAPPPAGVVPAAAPPPNAGLCNTSLPDLWLLPRPSGPPACAT